MAYKDEIPQFLSPMLRALEGDDSSFTPMDYGWDDDDPESLDPWGDMVGADPLGNKGRVGEDVLEQARFTDARQTNARDVIQLPDERDAGRALADKRAADSGVNPSQRGGLGWMIDLAKTQLGAPYVFGTAGGGTFDCSGFTKWLYSRAGVELPHQAKLQAVDPNVQSVGRDDLQPGDLIFYSYGRLGKDIDHVEVYMGGGKQIGTSNPTEDLDIDNIDWDNVVSFGRVSGVGQPVASGVGGAVGTVAGGVEGAAGAAANLAPDPALPKPEGKIKTTPVQQNAVLAPALLTQDYGDAAFSTVLAEVLTSDPVTQEVKYKTPKAISGDAVKRQLYQGFMDAGRPDLARMVGTKDFQTWIQQESGWNPGVSSPANNNGLRNDGLFQIWRGHSFNENGEVAQMSPYEQAQIVAKYFNHLDPQDIRDYAAAIRSGSYSGWG